MLHGLSCVVRLIKFTNLRKGHTPVATFYYNRIKATGSYENDVDIFLLQILQSYFSNSKWYGVEHERRVMEATPGVKQRADFTICDIKNELKVILNAHRGSKKRAESQGSMWRDAVEQLAGYMRLGATILYGAVVIGTYIHLYYLEPGEQTLRDYPTRETVNLYEFQSDEEEIDRILNEYAEITSPE